MGLNILCFVSGLLIILASFYSSVCDSVPNDSEDQSPVVLEIKALLLELFKRYSHEMDHLKQTLTLTKASIGQVPADLEDRIANIERHISASAGQLHFQRDANDIANEGPTLFSAVERRLSKLERLSKTYALRTCYELMKAMGPMESGQYFIDPDGDGYNTNPSIQVHCDLNQGITKIEHKLGGQVQRVARCSEAGCSAHRVEYTAPLDQIVTLVSLSRHCEQHIVFNCKGTPLLNQILDGAESKVEPLAWWTDRHGHIHSYWYGSGKPFPVFERAESKETEPHEDWREKIGCYCGPSNKACQNSVSGCSCDSAPNGGGPPSWSSDEGHLSNKSHLPLIQLNFKGAVDGDSDSEASFQLGPLYCMGSAAEDLQYGNSRGGYFVTSSPTSCQDLLFRGTTKTGYYMVRSREEKFPKVVFCDMAKLVGSAGFQRTFGSPGNLRHFVAFDASLSAPFQDEYRYVNFSHSVVNIGDSYMGSKARGSFNIQDGIFVVPVTGLYLFSIHALPENGKPCNLQIHHNGAPVAAVSNGGEGKSMVGQTILLNVAEGDEIRLYNNGGDIGGKVGGGPSESRRTSHLHFVGVLLFSSDRE